MDTIASVSIEGYGPFRQIEIRREAGAPAERIWQALTSDSEIHHWWAEGIIEPAADASAAAAGWNELLERLDQYVSVGHVY